MMSKGAFKRFLSEAKKGDSFWAERSILDFTSDLHQLLKDKGKSKSDLAEAIGSSPAYISKVFNGNVNFTIQTMVKLTRALNGQVSIRVTHEDRHVRWFDTIGGGAIASDDGTDWAKGTSLHDRLPGVVRTRVSTSG